MNQLAQVIQSNNFTNMSASDIVTALSVENYVRLDQTRYSYQGLAAMQAIGVTKTSILLAVLETLFTDPTLGNMIKAEYNSFTVSSEDGKVGGLDLSEPTRNTYLRNIAASLSQGDQTQQYYASVLLEIADIGGKTIPLWQKLNLLTLPSEGDVTSAMAQVADYEWAMGTIAVINSMLADGKTQTEIKAAIAGS